MADKKVGTKTGKSTQAGRDVYKTEDGENVSEKSTTFKYKGQWINVPSIHNGYQYDNDTLSMMLDAEVIAPTSTHESESDAVKAAVERSKSIAAKFNKGGTPMQRQMEFFEDGGLKDEGGMVDKESGNKVPLGGTRKGVRDDIPANISEGEFIFPEDVTRYIGLDKLMQMRQKAKLGLKKMEAMGQMGNGDEATVEDDLPFDALDLIVLGENDEPMEFANGGFVPSRNYAVGGTSTSNTSVTRTLGAPPNDVMDRPRLPTVTPPNTISPTRSLTPNIERAPRRNVTFKEIMSDALMIYVEYRNEAGDKMVIGHINGVPLTPIPVGYTLYEGDESIDTGNTEIDTVVEEGTKKAAADRAAKDDPKFTVANAEAVNWEELTTKELIAKAEALTGFGRTIASGALSFMGPVGVIGSFLMRHQDKSVAAVISARLASGGISTTEISRLKDVQDILLSSSKKGGILSKVISGVGNLLGVTEEGINSVKAVAATVDNNPNAVVTDTATGKPVVDNKVVKTLTTMPYTKEYLQTAGASNVVPTVFKDVEETGMEAFERELQGFTGEITEPIDVATKGMSSAEYLRNRKLNTGPFDGVQVTSSDPNAIMPTAIDGPFAGFPSAPTPGLTDDDMGLPTNAVPEPVAEQTEAAFTPSTPSYDMFGKPAMNATDRSMRDNFLSSASENANAQFATEQMLKNTEDTSALSKPLPGVDPNYRPVSIQPEFDSYLAPVPPKMTTDVTPTVAKSPFDNAPRYNPNSLQATAERAQGNYVPLSVEQAPVAAVPIQPNPNLQNVDPVEQAPVAAVPIQPNPNLQNVDPVTQQTEEVFANPAGPEDRYAGYVPQTGTGSYDEVPPLMPSVVPTPGLTDDDMGLPTKAVPASKTVAKPTFSETFKVKRNEALKGGPTVFEFDGKSYTTETKVEADAKAKIKADAVKKKANPFSNTGKFTSINPAISNVVNKTDTAVVKEDQSRYGDAGKGNVWAVKPGTNAVTKVKDTSSNKNSGKTATTTTRTTAEIQKDLNAEVGGGKPWTSKASALVKERDAAKANDSSGGGDSGGGGGGGGWSSYSCYVATALNDAGYWSTSKKLKLIKWCIEAKPENKLDTKLWRNGYVVFGKNVIAPKIDNKIIQWLSNGFYCATVQKETNLQSVLGKLFFYIPSYGIGLWKALRGNLVDIERT